MNYMYFTLDVCSENARKKLKSTFNGPTNIKIKYECATVVSDRGIYELVGVKNGIATTPNTKLKKTCRGGPNIFP